MLSWQSGQLIFKGVCIMYTVPEPDGDQDNPGAPQVGYSERDNDDGGQHHTLYDRGHDNHISWDSDPNGDYRDGSGHEDSGGHNVGNWDR